MKNMRSAVVLLAVGFLGCAAKKHLTADQYFQQANDNFRNEAYTVAVEEFHELLDQYPFSEYNEEAELKIAHAQYLNGSYLEAIVAFTDFQRRHPTSPNLPFVGYYLGMCYARQMGTIDRDQTSAQNAETYFVTVSRQYPDSPFAELARQELAHCRENLAEHVSVGKDDSIGGGSRWTTQQDVRPGAGKCAAELVDERTDALRTEHRLRQFGE